MAEEKKKEREWWEIPARSAVLVIALIVIVPEQWYKLAYIHTLGKLFPVTMESRLEEIQPNVSKRLPLENLPQELKIVVLKEERVVELWGKYPDGKWKFLNKAVILAVSSKKGAKLLEDDGKTPEGVYRVTGLNPQSEFYLALQLDYPSETDVKTAQEQGADPTRMGRGYAIHGFGFSSKGVAITNKGIEMAFYLAAKVGKEHTQVIISPRDFRKRPPSENMESAWLLKRYKMLEQKLNLLKREESSHAETGSH